MTLTGANPTAGAVVRNAPIATPGGAATAIVVPLLAGLPAGAYPYEAEIIDNLGGVLCTADPELVVNAIPTLSEWGLIAVVVVLLTIGTLFINTAKTRSRITSEIPTLSKVGAGQCGVPESFGMVQHRWYVEALSDRRWG